ncbi:heme-dependent oxidative N-demethylase subunit alpha family protein [Shimia ponticola]|uniref:heme-dependent oxidative N-demethylase subunit alpha family protein n=1 Tax=Shimia ponticola TaxID=2582893 RepID=UPI0011BE3666|nr:heme-dependent oxidative N-demethylase subunit alpha family protein [Shimia ponticola]
MVCPPLIFHDWAAVGCAVRDNCDPKGRFWAELRGSEAWEEKIGRPLTAIHDPVSEYTSDTARRVQRLFDGVKVGRPLWRYNQLWYQDPTLSQPRSSVEPRSKPDRAALHFRTEKQCMVRLPKSRAVVFSIHTWVLKRTSVISELQSWA